MQDADTGRIITLDGSRIERDKWFKPRTVAEAKAEMRGEPFTLEAIAEASPNIEIVSLQKPTLPVPGDKIWYRDGLFIKTDTLNAISNSMDSDGKYRLTVMGEEFAGGVPLHKVMYRLPEDFGIGSPPEDVKPTIAELYTAQQPVTKKKGKQKAVPAGQLTMFGTDGAIQTTLFN